MSATLPLLARLTAAAAAASIPTAPPVIETAEDVGSRLTRGHGSDPADEPGERALIREG